MREKLKKLRQDNNKTQKEMASILNISRSTYNNYEQGVAQPDIKTIIKLADYFKTTTDNILGHEVPYLLDKSIMSEKQKQVLEIALKLNDIQCQRILDFATGMKIEEK